MQLSELRANLKRLLDDDGVYRPDAVLDNTINDGYQMTSVLSQACERTVSFTYSINHGGHCAYLPADFFLPVGVYAGTTRMQPSRIADLNLLAADWFATAASTPLYYFTLGALGPTPTLWLYPRPSADVRVKLVYASVPDRLVNDASIPRIPQEHHYTLVQYSYAWELLKERGPLLANKAYREFIKFVEMLNQIQDTVYRRAPDRDWQMVPWDLEAARKKMLGFEMAKQQGPQTSELQDMSQ